jgi:UDP-GlcNAc:undecaprenyl-phosphate/decaprenyl-phosphate GlcNAc-1-phosphate transferase
MSRTVGYALLPILAAGFAVLATTLLLRSPEIREKNYRGTELPVVLGIGLAAAVFGSALIVFSIALWTARGARALIGVQAVFILLACLVVFLGGLYDDLVRGPTRGLLGHFRELARGRVSPGIVKLVAAVVAAVLVAWHARAGALATVVGIPVMAGATNLWNLLDVRPGRALKYFLPVCVALVAAAQKSDYGLVASAALGAAAVVLPFDLTEQAMLGDAGSNFLGFIVGVGMFQVLPAWGLLLVLGGIVALHLASETITLSRLIESAPPLRWYDDWGRPLIP